MTAKKRERDTWQREGHGDLPVGVCPPLASTRPYKDYTRLYTNIQEQQAHAGSRIRGKSVRDIRNL